MFYTEPPVMTSSMEAVGTIEFTGGAGTTSSAEGLRTIRSMETVVTMPSTAKSIMITLTAALKLSRVSQRRWVSDAGESAERLRGRDGAAGGPRDGIGAGVKVIQSEMHQKPPQDVAPLSHRRPVSRSDEHPVRVDHSPDVRVGERAALRALHSLEGDSGGDRPQNGLPRDLPPRRLSARRLALRLVGAVLLTLGHAPSLALAREFWRCDTCMNVRAVSLS